MAQMLGAFIGGALVYAVYYDAITHWEHKVTRLALACICALILGSTSTSRPPTMP